jgi:hypothetical protein
MPIAGDILVLLQWSSGGAIPTTVIPSGFTTVTTIDNAASRKMNVSYKLATGAEASAAITGMDDTSDQKILAYFRPNIPATTLTLASVGQEYNLNDPAAQTVASGSGTPPLIVLGAYGSQGVIATRTFTVAGSPAADGELSEASNDLVYLKYKIYNSSPADVVVDMGDSGQNFLVSCYIRVQ